MPLPQADTDERQLEGGGPDLPDGAAPAARPRRWPWLAALLAALVAVAVAVVVALGGTGSDPVDEPVAEQDPAPETSLAPLEGASPASRMLGTHPGHPNSGGLAQFAATEAWLGRDLASMVQFGDGSSVEAFLANLNGQFSSKNLGGMAEDRAFRLVYSVPMAFGGFYDGSEEADEELRQQWQAVVDGTDGRREVYRRAAEVLDDSGYGDAVIRLGWEFDNHQSRWFAGADPALFVEAWRVIHAEFRDVSEGFVFDYNYIRGSAGKPIVDQAYPGDDYVDIIGLDIYDAGWSGPGGVPEGAAAGWEDPGRVWREHQLPALAAHRDFALAHGKPVSFPEWGLAGGGQTKQGSSGGDNPSFIRGMHDWMSSLEGPDGPGLAYHAYFDIDARSHAGPHAIEAFPQSAAVFEELFGRSGS